MVRSISGKFPLLFSRLDSRWPVAADAWAKYILSGGLFSFAGGMTNWLAVKMLFDRIPGLIGSGVIPNRFREIRQSVGVNWPCFCLNLYL